MSRLDNRHALTEYFDKLNSLQNSKDVYCLIFLDLDKFKKINDQYGHKIGDDLLIDFSTNLMEMMRKGDFCCRWGCDEFVIVLPVANEVDHSIIKENLDSRFLNLRKK